MYKFWTLRFRATLSELWDNVRCLSWKACSGFSVSVNWTFFATCYGWGATGENRLKIGDLQTGGSSPTKFSHRTGRRPPIIFARLVRPMNALQLCRWQFSRKETLSQTFFNEMQFFYGNRPSCVFRPPLGDLGATYDDHLRLIGKRVRRVVDFLLALIDLFFARCYGWGATNDYRFKIAILLQRGPVDPKFQVEGVAHTNHSSSQ